MIALYPAFTYLFPVTINVSAVIPNPMINRIAKLSVLTFKFAISLCTGMITKLEST